MITIKIATRLIHGQTLYHISATNADGSALRCRVNGKCKTWVTKPDKFMLPVKHGLRDCFYITPDNAHEWQLTEPLVKGKVNPASDLAKSIHKD